MNKYISGLCDGSKFDAKYSWTRSMMGGRHNFRGYTGTMLQYNDTTSQWILQPTIGGEGISAVTDGPEYPFGNHDWTITGDPCYTQTTNHVTLNINACNSTEFNCDDGYCVDINMRCDGRSDCPDKTGKWEKDYVTIYPLCIYRFTRRGWLQDPNN